MAAYDIADFREKREPAAADIVMGTYLIVAENLSERDRPQS